MPRMQMTTVDRMSRSQSWLSGDRGSTTEAKRHDDMANQFDALYETLKSVISQSEYEALFIDSRNGADNDEDKESRGSLEDHYRTLMESDDPSTSPTTTEPWKMETEDLT